MHWPWYSFLDLLPSRPRQGLGVGVWGRTGPPPTPPVPRHARDRRGEGLNRGFVLLAGADAQRGFDGRDEDLAVADAPGGGGRGDRLDHLLGLRVGHHDLELHLGQEVDDVLGAAVELGVALLPAK